MKNRIKKRLFYFDFQRRSREEKQREAQSQHSDPLQLGNEVWGNVMPVGREFGAAEITEEPLGDSRGRIGRKMRLLEID